MKSGVTQTTTDKIVVADNVKADVTLNNVNIDLSRTVGGAFQLQNNSSVNLNLKGENKLKSANGIAGISVPENTSITIDGLGSITAEGGACAAGIGSDRDMKAGSITINGGMIKAITISSMGDPAGIGGGGFSDAGTIKITGGTVTANGSQKGIGSGAGKTNGSIEITGGTVIANGIGSGGYKSSTDTKISGNAVIFCTDTQFGGVNKNHQSSWNGIVFEGNNGVVYGTTTLVENLEVSSDKILTVKNNAKLTIDNKNLTNKGTIENRGTINNKGVVDNQGTVKNYGIIEGTMIGGTVLNPSQVTVTITSVEGSALNNDIAVIGDTIKIIASVGTKTTNKSRNVPSVNTVDFYLNSVSDDNKINTNPVNVNNNQAILETTLDSLKWGTGNKTIYAVYGGTTNLVDSEGSTTLTINDLISKEIAIETIAPVKGEDILDGLNISPTGSSSPVITWSDDSGVTWDASGKFEPFTVYQTKYVYTANAGYSFSDSLVASNITVTNKGAGSVTASVSNDRLTLTVIVTWPKTEPNVLSGDISINGTLKYNEELTATISGSNNTGTFTYQWKRENENIGINSDKYTTVESDIGKTITCEVTSSIESGKLTATTSAIQKQDGPVAPNVSFSFDGNNLNKLIGSTSSMEYSIDGGTNYNDCTEDMDLTSIVSTITADKDIKIRVKETNTIKVGIAQTVDIIEGLEVIGVTSENCVSVDENDGKLIGITSAMEYKKSTDTIWLMGTGNDITNLTNGTYNVRYKSTGTTLAGEISDLIIEESLPILVGVSVKKTSDKVNYIEGDSFEPLGLILTLTYNKGPNVEVDYNANNKNDFSFNPSSGLMITDNEITITYGGKITTQTIFVVINEKNEVLKAKSLAISAIEKIVATNDTTASSILDVVNKEIASVKGVVASWKDNSYVLAKSTESENGSVIGIIILSIGKESLEIPINSIIEKLPKTNNSTSDWVEDPCKWYECNPTVRKDLNKTTETKDKIVEVAKPTINSKTNSTYQVGKDEDMMFYLSGNIKDLEGIYVNDELVNESNYSLDSENLILTLKSSYLDSLPQGDHMLAIQYKNNVTAKLNFTIVIKDDQTPTSEMEATAKPTIDSSQESNTNNGLLYGSLVVIASGCVAMVFMRKRKISKK